MVFEASTPVRYTWYWLKATKFSSGILSDLLHCFWCFFLGIWLKLCSLHKLQNCYLLIVKHNVWQPDVFCRYSQLIYSFIVRGLPSQTIINPLLREELYRRDGSIQTSTSKAITERERKQLYLWFARVCPGGLVTWFSQTFVVMICSRSFCREKERKFLL